MEREFLKGIFGNVSIYCMIFFPPKNDVNVDQIKSLIYKFNKFSDRIFNQFTDLPGPSKEFQGYLTHLLKI